MYENLLPIGSVVLLKEANKRLMITGRLQTKMGDPTIYEYSGCYYPEGITGADSMFFFNHDAIAAVFYIGFQDTEEFDFRTDVLGKLGELEVVDGRIVPKAQQ